MGPLPATVRAAGRVETLPEGALKGEGDTTDLLARVRRSELKNARAVGVCKAHHAKQRELWSK